jgi:uncharacterized repeat protein (TIGR02543 family)
MRTKANLQRQFRIYLSALLALIIGFSTLPVQSAYAIAVNCGGAGTFTVVNNVVTTSDLTCAGAVVIPNGVTSIAASAFSRLGKTPTEQARITSVSIPNSVITIGESAFRDCRNATSLTIGTAVTSIGNDAFNNYIGLTTLVIPGSVQTIGDRAFANVNFTTLTLNEGLLTVGDSAFLGNKLVTLAIPNSVTTISTEAAFAGWGYIETLTLGSGLTTIGNRTFEGIGRLQSLTIPRGVTTLGTNAFRDYPQSTYTYCGTSLTQTVLNNSGLTGKTNTLNCPVNQTITRTSTSPVSPVKSGTYTPTATASSSLTVAISIASGSSSVCSISSGIVTFNAAGSCVINYNQAGNSNYYAATQVTETLVIGKATPTFSTWSNVSKSFGDSAFTVTAPSVTGSIPGTFQYSSATTSVMSVSGSTLTVVGVGTSVITATFTPTDSTNYNSATISMTVTINKGIPIINTWNSNWRSRTYGNANFNLDVATANVPGTFVYTSGSPSVISLNGRNATVAGAGTAIVTASFTPTDTTNYESTATASLTFNVLKNTPSLTWNNFSKSMGDSSFVLAAPTSTTPGTFTYTSATPGVISLNGDVATVTGIGTSLITANFTPTDTNNYGTTTKTITITVDATAQTITRTSTSPISPVRYETYTPTATASSSLSVAITIASGSTSVCSIASGVVTFNTVGNCVIQYNQSGDATYSAATQVTETLAIGQETPTFNWISGTSRIYGASSFDLATPESSTPGTWIYSSGSPSVASISGSTVTIVGYGSSIITATFTPTDATNYVSGGTVTMNFLVAKAALAVTASSHTVAYGDAIPSITPVYSGFVNGDSSTVVSGISCSTSYTTTTAVGSTGSNCTGVSASNYSVTYSSGVITVNPKGLTISGLTGISKEFDGGLSGSVTGTPSLVGVVNSDNVLLSGTPTFTFASANVANGITVTASGYTLTGTTAGNYTLTQPTVTANITAKAARVAATNTTVAFGAAVTSGFTTSGLISPDVVGSASYTYTGTGTATPPTAVGVYTVTPSNAVFSTGLVGNYSITYDTATVTILAKYTITYNANGGSVSNGSTATIDFVVGDTALTLPTPTRPNYTFTGWYTLQTNGVQVTGAYTPSATATLWARWIQNSLYGMGTNTKILTITTLSGVGNTYSANAGGGTIAIEYLADALPPGTVIDAYVLSDTSTATSLIGAGNDYVMSLVLAWVATDETVPSTAAGKPITMTITNSSIKRGAKIYSVIGVTPTLLTTATTDGSAVISITDDPQIIIAITKPDAPTGVSATSGGNASTTVSWTAPSDGGSAITSYTATSNAGQTCTSATTSCSITGLTNGSPYTFTVTATNAIGTSDASSASGASTPAAPVVISAPVVAPTPDPAVIAALAAAKVAAEKAAAEAIAAAAAKAAADKKAADEAELAAIIKALQEQAAAEAAALAAAKKAADELRIAEELRIAQEKADAALKAAAEKKALEDAAAAAAALLAAKKIVPQVSLYIVSSQLKLSAYDTAYLKKYISQLAPSAKVTCVGYIYSKNTTYAKAKALAQSQAKAVCALIKKEKKTITTATILYPASKAPKAAAGSKYVAVSYRIDSFKK